ncbi:MAG TPA: hypothetical protein VGF69_04765 [Thermoanaerobaculia bacterium]|jgi:hypothetical protein
MPRIEAAQDGPPLWVPASIAVQPDGELSAAYFDPVRLQRLEQNRARNSEGCLSYLSSGPMSPAAIATIEDRVPAAYTIVAGEVTAAEDGFYAGMPGTLFTVQITRRLKMFGHAHDATELYVFVAGGDIATSRGHICSTAGPGAVVPRRGDRLVVFSQLPAHDVNRHLIRPDPRAGIIIERDHTLLGPANLRTGRPADLASIVRAIEHSQGATEVPSRAGQ